MGKKAHGRLVHEIREALYRAGFMPTRVTQLDTPKGLRAMHSPGFKVEKHNDGKSVRLLHVTTRVAAEPSDRHSRLSLEREQVKRLIGYSAALKQEGFARVAPPIRDRPAPYSLWRRTVEARSAATLPPQNDGR